MNADLLNQLVQNLIDAVEEIQSVVVADRDGLIITSKSSSEEQKDQQIGAATAVFDSFIGRIKKEFGSTESFLNITTVDDQKFLFADAGPQAILTIMADEDVDETKLKVYAEHISDKLALVIDEKEVKPEIPFIVDVLAKMRHGKLPKGEYTEKLIVVGDPMVGKTSLIRRFVDNSFKENYISSIGVDISKKTVELSEGSKISFTIWDIGGQIQTMAPYRKRFYNGAEHVFLQFDITRKKTFENLDKWLNDLDKNTDQMMYKTIIGNKIDKLDEQAVSIEEIEAKADELDCPYILTSAKTGDNVNDAFKYAGYKFFQKL